MNISLPPEVIYDISYIIKRTRNTSPRGVADGINSFFNESDAKIAPEHINACANQFLKDVMQRARTFTDHCHRMTTVPGDVAKALDSYAETEAKADENKSIAYDYVLEEEAEAQRDEDAATNVGDVNLQDIQKLRSGMIQLQARVRGAQVRDHEIIYDRSESDFGDEEVYIDSSIYDEENTTAQIFDATYPPIENISLPDEMFKQDVLLPFLQVLGNAHYGGVQLGNIGQRAEDYSYTVTDDDSVIVGMLKRATYAYLCKTLS